MPFYFLEVDTPYLHVCFRSRRLAKTKHPMTLHDVLLSPASLSGLSGGNNKTSAVPGRRDQGGPLYAVARLNKHVPGLSAVCTVVQKCTLTPDRCTAASRCWRNASAAVDLGRRMLEQACLGPVSLSPSPSGNELSHPDQKNLFPSTVPHIRVIILAQISALLFQRRQTKSGACPAVVPPRRCDMR